MEKKKKEVCCDCGRPCKKLLKYKGRCKEFEGKKYCGRCLKKIPSNPFFISKEKRENKHISNFSISKQERNVIFKRSIKQGLTERQAWSKINYLSNGMRMAHWRKAKADKAKKIKEQIIKKDASKNKDTFLKGLGQK